MAGGCVPQAQGIRSFAFLEMAGPVAGRCGSVSAKVNQATSFAKLLASTSVRPVAMSQEEYPVRSSTA